MKISHSDTRGLARVGVVVPMTNTNLEPDMMMMAPTGVSVHFSRSGGYDPDAIPDEHQMRQYSDTHSNEIVNNLRHCRSEIILYGCTSATLAQGPEYDEAFRKQIKDRTHIPTMTAARSLVEALTSLDIETFAFTSPYVASLNDLAVSFIEESGFRCVGRADAPMPLGNTEVATISPAEILALAEQANTDKAEAIVLSCTDMRSVEAVEDIERKLGKPVITSNQAMMVWACLHLGIPFDSSPLCHHMLVKKLLEMHDIAAVDRR